MRRISIGKNIDEFIGDGLKWGRKLPNDIVKKFEGKGIRVLFDNYPCIEKKRDEEEFSEYWQRVGGYQKKEAIINNPKTFGDILKPYVENITDLITGIDSGKLKDWEYGHYYNCLWAEEFVFDGDSVKIEIGS